MSTLGTCTVCGMHIHIKSIHLNAMTMVEPNSSEALVQCPFCGIRKSMYESIHPSLEKVHLELSLEGRKVIENAMKLEVFNSEFYDEASQLVTCGELASLFKELSRVELTHAKIHQTIGGFDTLPVLHKPDYGNRESDQVFILEAEAREKHAIAYYRDKGPLMNHDLVKQVFDALGDVESQHKTIMETSMR